MKTCEGYNIKDYPAYKSYLFGRYGHTIDKDLKIADKWLDNLPADYGQVDIEIGDLKASINDSKLLDKFLKKV